MSADQNTASKTASKRSGNVVEITYDELGWLTKFTHRIEAFRMRSRGYASRPAKKWAKSEALDMKLHEQMLDRSFIKKANKAGYLSMTASRIGADLAFSGNMISQREYLYLRPLNGKYGNWLSDRISALNVFGGFKEFFEDCHFHIIRRDNSYFSIPLTEQAKEFAPDVKGLHQFLEKYGEMAISSSLFASANHWMLSAQEDGAFLLDDELMSMKEFTAWLSEASLHRALVIYKVVEPLPFLKELSEGAEASITVLMLNKNGDDPEVAQAMIKSRYDVSKLDGFWSDEEEDDLSGNEEEGEEEEPEFAKGVYGRFFSQISYKTFRSEIDVHNGTFSGLHTVDPDDKTKIVSIPCAPDSEVPFEGVVPGWGQIEETLVKMFRWIPQVEMGEFEIVITQQGFKITALRSQPSYYRIIPFTPEVSAFLLGKYNTKRSVNAKLSDRIGKIFHNLKLGIRRRFRDVIAPEGLVPYQSVRWIGDKRRDNKAKTDLTRAQKKWAHKHGFLSYRLEQYGVTEDNWENFISDYEYRWLRHINPKYRYWLEDKITLKYVASDFRECFPGYYYYTSLKNGANRIIPMMDLPEELEATKEDILKLAKMKKVLALKPDEGSHGEGFYKLAWEGDHFELNGEEASEERIFNILENPDNQYIITEYILMHPEIAKFYPQSVNTIRVTVFKKDGRTPEIGNVYFRIGNSLTGFVDNVAAGGIAVHVDIETGRLDSPRRLDGINQGNLVPCLVHPDTGVPIEGVLPDWQEAKAKILAIAESIPQLEYMGFDLAITEDGIRLPEINRFPDFPRVHAIEPQLTDYLLYKLDAKKKKYGYDKVPSGKILELPARSAKH